MAITESELHAFYAQLGEARYSVQIVKGTLHRVLAIKVDFAGQKITQAEADRVLEAYRLKTLGD